MWKTKSKALRIQDRISVWPQGGKKIAWTTHTHTHTQMLTVNEKIDHCYHIQFKNLLVYWKMPLRDLSCWKRSLFNKPHRMAFFLKLCACTTLIKI